MTGISENPIALELPGLSAVRVPRAAESPDLAIETDRLSADAWNRLTGDFVDVTYEQTAFLLDDYWGTKRTSHLVVRRNGVAIGGARVLLLQLPMLGGGFAYVKFGPFWRRRGAAPDLADYRAVIRGLVDEYCVRRGCYLSIFPRPNPTYYPEEIKVLAELGFCLGHPSVEKNRYFVDLSLDHETQMRSLEQKWRYNLHQAFDNRIEISCGDGEREIAAFMALHEAMVARKRVLNYHPVHLIPGLLTRLPAAMRPQIFLGWHGERPIVGAVIAILGDTASYAFGASADEALPLKAGYAMQWSVVRWLSEHNVRWYDLGSELSYQGLRQFKKGLVGKRGVILPISGEFARWKHFRARFFADALYLARRAERATRSFRNLLREPVALSGLRVFRGRTNAASPDGR